jgi:hypothetical protein
LRRYLAGAATALAFALSGFVAVGAGSTDNRRVIYIRNTSTAVSAKAVRDALPAFQTALDKDFAPIWDADAKLVYIGRSAAPSKAWVINLVTTPQCLSCAGYHSFDGIAPSAVVGTGKAFGNWQVTFTHELFEMEADPYPRDDGSGIRAQLVGTTWYAVETGDPVEATAYSYTRKSATGKAVRISDFVLPAWFDPSNITGPWDFKKHTTRALEILPQGYQIIYRNGSWTTLP